MTSRTFCCESNAGSGYPGSNQKEISGHHRLPPCSSCGSECNEPQVSGPNQTWVSDINYVWTRQGWLYLACVSDLYSRKDVGWSMSSQMTKDLVLDALQMAIIRRCPKGSLLHHSDLGSQYCNEEYQRILNFNGIQYSMSRKGDCCYYHCDSVRSHANSVKRILFFLQNTVFRLYSIRVCGTNSL